MDLEKVTFEKKRLVENSTICYNNDMYHREESYKDKRRSNVRY